eukprot:PITA_09114
MEFRSVIVVPKVFGKSDQIEIGARFRFGRHIMLKRKKRVSGHVIRAANPGSDCPFDSGSWSIVDANMIVLRKRISEMKAKEENYEFQAEWMQWERNLYPSHQSNILQAIGWLQLSLINARPSVVFAVLTLITLWLPTSVLIAMVVGAGYVTEFILTVLQFISNS